MKIRLLLVCLLVSEVLIAQNFEISGMQETYRGSIGDLIKASVKLKNTSGKPITLVIRKAEAQLGSSQKSFFCLDNNCIEKSDELVIKIEPGQTIQNIQIGVEAGLVEGSGAIRYVVYSRSAPAEITSLDLNFAVESKLEKSNIYSSRFITIHDVYPNPVTNYANIDYQLHSEEVKAKIVIHTILGNALYDYDLPSTETRIKILADDLNAGIYFYTLYIDNVGVMTRKLIVKK
jgi:Secretion system C-terminal sorting domain